MSDTLCPMCGTPWTNKVPFWVRERTQTARLRDALEAIRDYEGPNPENAMREIAGSALAANGQ